MCLPSFVAAAVAAFHASVGRFCIGGAEFSQRVTSGDRPEGWGGVGVTRVHDTAVNGSI